MPPEVAPGTGKDADLRELIERLRRAADSLEHLRTDRERVMDSANERRLAGKREGVLLALSYAREYVTAPAACTPESPSCEAHKNGRSWLLACPLPPEEVTK